MCSICPKNWIQDLVACISSVRNIEHCFGSDFWTKCDELLQQKEAKVPDIKTLTEPSIDRAKQTQQISYPPQQYKPGAATVIDLRRTSYRGLLLLLASYCWKSLKLETHSLIYSRYWMCGVNKTHKHRQSKMLLKIIYQKSFKYSYQKTVRNFGNYLRITFPKFLNITKMQYTRNSLWLNLLFTLHQIASSIKQTR